MPLSNARLHLVVILTSMLICTTGLQAVAKVISVSIPFVGSPQHHYITARDQYHRFRIPTVVVACDGSVLSFAEGRRGYGGDPTCDNNAPIDIVMRRSTDHGKTWEPMVVLDSGFRPGGGLVDYGDPTAVVDSITGAVFLMYGQWADTGPHRAPHGQNPAAGLGQQVVWILKSTDNGKTWSQRRQIIYPDEPHETSDKLYWEMVEPGPGIGIQLQWQDHNPSLNGRLVIPAKRNGSVTPAGPTNETPLVFYSDDHGETWQVGQPATGPQANEDDIVELTDGRLLLDARQVSGRFRRRYFSNDGGQTWGPNHPDDLVLTDIDTSMIRYSATREGHDRNRILFSAPRGTGRILTREHDEGDLGLTRNNLTIWTSYDEGRSFIHPVRITYEMAGYSAMHRLADGTIGLLVESAGENGLSYGDITFFRFEVSELEDASRWEQ
jgi:sialidase-1